jgi:hypothetical protein
MAKPAKTKTPIMTPDQRYVAFFGLVQWTQAVVTQSARASEARDRLLSSLSRGPNSTLRQRLEATQRRFQATGAWHTECHFFAIAALKLLEYQKWAVRDCGLCASVDFSEVDRFSARDIRHLRDMGEHILEYYKGVGKYPERWTKETPEYQTNGPALVGTEIGGRLDWVAFGAAAERLLPQLLAEPIPYPSRATRPSTA